MKKRVVCVFAHPDDEAFGPSGTIYKLSKKYDVYLLCATKGEIGKDSSSNGEILSKTRAEELRRSAKVLGIKKVYFLGFIDGQLSNSNYHKLVLKIEGYVKKIKPEIILTQELRGISGHIDHIVVSSTTSFVFMKHKFIKELWYVVMPDKHAEIFGKDYFVFWPPGYKKDEITKVVDVSDVWKTKIEAMIQHVSQRHDFERIIKIRENLPKEEYFVIKKQN